MKRSLLVSLCLALLLSGCSVIDGIAEGIFGTAEPGAQIDPSEYEDIGDLLQLRDFVAEQRQQGLLEFSFIYSGSEDLDPGVVAQMSGTCFVKAVQQGTLYHITLTEFPGERIVKAYFSGDSTNLTEPEKEAMEIAEQMVETARENAKNDWELELLLHDSLAGCITYSDADIHYDEPEDQPRHLSVIGALLDGEANCQGYTDAFYTLASIAGFEVGRLSVETSTDPHMVNTVCLDGQWYVVDLTYNDSADEILSYHLFNAGLDLIGQEYTWAEEVELHPIAAESDENSYLIRNGLVFEDLDALTEFVAEDWAERGNTVIHAMLKGEPDSEKLSHALPDALEKWERSYSYSIWHKSNGIDSFYTVVFQG